MLRVLLGTWALLLGIFLLMVGNGMQGTLLGIRGAIEGYSPATISLVLSGYFVGFLGGSRLAPVMIARVGHVRVFAALGSFISATLIIFPTVVDPIAWAILRVVIGFCFSAVYVVAESWLNDTATNDTRGQTLSLYLIAQMSGIVAAQLLLNVADPAGFVLFIIPSVLVSIAFAPMLLAATQQPSFSQIKPMKLRDLVRASPLAFVGVFLLGGIFAAQFGMAAVYGTQIGLSVADISIFISVIYVGGVALQYPVGWLSDRMDRRILVLVLSVIAALAMVAGAVVGHLFVPLLVVSFLMGGISNPLYSLLVAYLNDYLDPSDMAAASSGLIFVNGIGAIFGPVIVGAVMQAIGPAGFFVYLGVLFAVMAGYAAWRTTRRRTHKPVETTVFTPVTQISTPVASAAAAEQGNVVAQQ